MERVRRRRERDTVLPDPLVECFTQSGEASQEGLVVYHTQIFAALVHCLCTISSEGVYIVRYRLYILRYPPH